MLMQAKKAIIIIRLKTKINAQVNSATAEVLKDQHELSDDHRIVSMVKKNNV